MYSTIVQTILYKENIKVQIKNLRTAKKTGVKIYVDIYSVMVSTSLHKGDSMADHIVDRLGKSKDGTVDLSQRVIRKSEFGKRLFDLMIQKGWNQSDLARQAEMGRDSVSTYIRGRSVPTPQNLDKLSSALGISSEELYPNYSANAAALEEPVMQIKQVNDDSGKMWLTISMKVESEKAIAVMKILYDKS